MSLCIYRLMLIDETITPSLWKMIRGHDAMNRIEQHLTLLTIFTHHSIFAGPDLFIFHFVWNLTTSHVTNGYLDVILKSRPYIWARGLHGTIPSSWHFDGMLDDLA